VVPENDELASAWGIEAVPTLVLLDAEGRFAGAYRGVISEQEMAQILDALSAGEALPDIGRAEGDHQLP
jgi:thioredoxin-like negative regulator of GroEL